jgi:hypothetical protein
MSRSESESNGQSGGKTVRQKLIEEAMFRCHQSRSEVQKQKFLTNSVPRKVALRFQQTISDYYAALRPLRQNDPVQDWWDSVELSKRWIKDIRVETEPVVTGDYIGREQVGVKTRKKRVVDRYEGLDALERLGSMTETKEITKSTMRGVRKETTSRLKLLDPGVLIDISFTLDDAADKLGFSPNVESEMPRDETDLEDLKGVTPLATIERGEVPDLGEFNVDVGGE